MFIYLLIIAVFFFAVTGLAAARLGVSRYEALIGLGFIVTFAGLNTIINMSPIDWRPVGSSLWMSLGIAGFGALAALMPHFAVQHFERQGAPARKTPNAIAAAR